MVTIVVGGSVSGGITVVSVVVDELVLDVLLDVVVPGTVVVVVGGGAAVTVNPTRGASSLPLKAWIVAAPPVAAGGTASVPPNDDEPRGSAVPILVLVVPWMKSMTMQLVWPLGHSWNWVKVMLKHHAGRATLGGHGWPTLAAGVG